jgi:hypothetical protein
MIRPILLATLATTMIPMALVHALAADLPSREPAPPPQPLFVQASQSLTWQGFYVSATAGRVSGVKGATAGLGLGYGHQSGNVVYGIEADFSGGITKEPHRDYFGTVRGRSAMPLVASCPMPLVASPGPMMPSTMPARAGWPAAASNMPSRRTGV